MELTIRNVTKAYRARGGKVDTLALDDVSLTAAEGEFVSILGPSGCGKSTLLNCIAGLVPYDSGDILVDGVSVQGPGLERAVVFQHASLLPWRTAERNVLYGMELQCQLPKAKRRERCAWAIELVGLTGFEHHYPYELSGGMQQRINLARALATSPKVLLMDEPFGALDAMTKQYLQQELVKISAVTGHTVVFITHDISEAVFLSDRVVVMSPRPGRIRKIVRVDRPKQRDLSFKREQYFQDLRNELWDLLEGSPASDPASPSAQGAPQEEHLDGAEEPTGIGSGRD
jgi:NitT/TauT family transport system ATP-binding protein